VLNGKTISIEWTKIAKGSIPDHFAAILSNQHWIVTGLSIQQPSMTISQIDHSIIPNRGAIENSIIINGKDR
jgi:hypothetical protein